MNLNLNRMPALVLGVALQLTLLLGLAVTPAHAAAPVVGIDLTQAVATNCGSFSVTDAGVVACDPPTTAPVCRPTFIISSDLSAAVLTANCSPGPITSYSWARPAGQPITTNPVSVPYVAGATYTLTATNDFGSGVAVPVVLGAPACTLTPAAWTISPSTGIPVTLTAYCPGGATYSWSTDNFTTTFPPTTPTTVVGVIPTATTTIYVKATNPAGTGAAASATATLPLPLSACSSISPSAPSVTVGSASPQLTATCSNSPYSTGHVWKLGSATLSCTGSTCVVPAASLPTVGSYTVTVTANNAGGTGTASASATITVALQPLSACILLSPASQNVTLGSSSSLLTATCDNNPTGYAWNLDGAPLGACTTPGLATCTVPATRLTAEKTYGVTVKANNAGGTGTAPASATITTVPVPQALSACTSISPPTSSITVGSASPLLTATCSNSPYSTGYVWKLGGATLSCTGSTCTVPAGSLSTTATYTATVTANNAAGTGTASASATITATSSVAGCPTSATITKNWSASPAGGINEVVDMTPGQTLAVKFHTGNSVGAGSVLTTYTLLTQAQAVDRYATISTCPGDFSVSTPYCYVNGSADHADLQYYVGSHLYSCSLLPNADYYFNLRHANPNPIGQFTSFTETCTTGSCGFLLQYSPSP